MSFNPAQLRDAERHVLTATVRGEIADFTDGQWSQNPKPAVRAVFLRHLLLGLPLPEKLIDDWTVRLPGLRVKGALIEGVLDLRDCAGKGADGLPAIELLECDIPGMIDISHARIARFSISRSSFQMLLARNTHIQGPFEFKNVKPYAQSNEGNFAIIDATGAFVEGDVSGQDSHLHLPSHRIGETALDLKVAYALRLSETYIRGSVFLDRAILIGGLSIATAQIGGDLRSIALQATSGESYALNAGGLKIGGSVGLLLGLKVHGNIRFAGAQIGAALTLGGSHGSASIGDHHSSHVAGQLDLTEARVTGSVSFHGEFNCADDYAVAATGMRVGGDLILAGSRPRAKDRSLRATARRGPIGSGYRIDDTGNQQTTFSGGAKFSRCQVDGKLSWDGLHLQGPGPSDGRYHWFRRHHNTASPILNLSDIIVRHSIEAYHLVDEYKDGSVSALIDLTGASCDALDDFVDTGWGSGRTGILLDGFEYKRLEGRDVGMRWAARKRWLNAHYEKLVGSTTPQPYQQLARFYGSLGMDRDFAMVQQRLRWRQLSERIRYGYGFTDIIMMLYGFVAGFGYAPLRLTYILALFILMGGLGIESANENGRLIVAQSNLNGSQGGDVNEQLGEGKTWSLGKPCGANLNPYVYAFDLALPGFDFRQETQCVFGVADPNELFGAIDPSGRAIKMAARAEDVHNWQAYAAIYSVLGHMLFTLAALTFGASILQRRQPGQD